MYLACNDQYVIQISASFLDLLSNREAQRSLEEIPTSGFLSNGCEVLENGSSRAASSISDWGELLMSIKIVSKRWAWHLLLSY